MSFIVPAHRRTVHSGQRFTRLVVLGVPFYLDNSRQHCVAQCDCGESVLARVVHLKSGDTQSCGCLQVELARARKATHGGGKTRLYNVWKLMCKRCGDANSNRYKDYGGRGIGSCDEWEKFEPFRDWALANGYRDDLTIDRIDNDGNYEQSNCRWATNVEQQNNRRDNVLVTAFGETKTVAQWSRDERCVVTRGTLWRRIRSGTRSAEAALAIPSLNQRSKALS